MCMAWCQNQQRQYRSAYSLRLSNPHLVHLICHRSSPGLSKVRERINNDVPTDSASRSEYYFDAIRSFRYATVLFTFLKRWTRSRHLLVVAVSNIQTLDNPPPSFSIPQTTTASTDIFFDPDLFSSNTGWMPEASAGGPFDGVWNTSDWDENF
jgi:hypothetical protein